MFNSEREVSCGTCKIPDAVKSNADKSIGPQSSARRNEVGIKRGELQKNTKGDMPRPELRLGFLEEYTATQTTPLLFQVFHKKSGRFGKDYSKKFCSLKKLTQQPGGKIEDFFIADFLAGGKIFGSYDCNFGGRIFAPKRFNSRRNKRLVHRLVFYF